MLRKQSLKPAHVWLESCQEILGGKASLGRKPLKEEEALTESFKDIIVDKTNKEDFH